MKTHAKGVAETMGSVIDSHCQKRRGKLELKKLEKNPSYIKVDPGASYNLGKKSLNRFYKGHSWYLVTKTGALESTVLKNVCQQKLRVPFF